jgi:hypothetical protein
LDQNSIADEGINIAAPAEDGNKNMEDHYYRVHKAAFNMQAFPPGKVVYKNTKIKPRIEIYHIRHVVHIWNNYIDREENKTLSYDEHKTFALFMRTYKAGNEFIIDYKTIQLEVNGSFKDILCHMKNKKDGNDEETVVLGHEVII